MALNLLFAKKDKEFQPSLLLTFKKGTSLPNSPRGPSKAKPFAFEVFSPQKCGLNCPKNDKSFLGRLAAARSLILLDIAKFVYTVLPKATKGKKWHSHLTQNRKINCKRFILYMRVYNSFSHFSKMLINFLANCY